MEGPDNGRENPETMGMIPRAVQQIFSTSQQLAEKGWTYSFEAQFLEIYNENIRDLLSSEDGKKYEIRHQNGKTTITDSITGMHRAVFYKLSFCSSRHYS